MRFSCKCAFFSRAPILIQVVPSDAACVWAFIFRYRSNDCSYTFPRSYVREMRDIFQFARKTFKKNGLHLLQYNSITHL